MEKEDTVVGSGGSSQASPLMGAVEGVGDGEVSGQGGSFSGFLPNNLPLPRAGRALASGLLVMSQDVKEAPFLFGLPIIDVDIFNFLIFKEHQKLIERIGIPQFTVLRKYILCFLQMEALWQPHLEQVYIGTIFPAVIAHFVSLCHILLILAIFQTSSLLLYLSW